MASQRSSDPLAAQLNTAMQQLLSQTFGRYCPDQTWSPSVNIYQLAGRLEICVDLAGVDRDNLAVRVEPGRLEIRGQRQPPDPPDHGEGPMRILSMEIDYGEFCRQIRLPNNVDLNAVESRYTEGLLWIVLPLTE